MSKIFSLYTKVRLYCYHMTQKNSGLLKHFWIAMLPCYRGFSLSARWTCVTHRTHLTSWICVTHRTHLTRWTCVNRITHVTCKTHWTFVTDKSCTICICLAWLPALPGFFPCFSMDLPRFQGVTSSQINRRAIHLRECPNLPC